MPFTQQFSDDEDEVEADAETAEEERGVDTSEASKRAVIVEGHGKARAAGS